MAGVEGRPHGLGEQLQVGTGGPLWGRRGGRARAPGQAEVFGLGLAGEP